MHSGELKYAGYAEEMKITYEEHENLISFQVGCLHSSYSYMPENLIFYL